MALSIAITHEQAPVTVDMTTVMDHQNSDAVKRLQVFGWNIGTTLTKKTKSSTTHCTMLYRLRYPVNGEDVS